MNISEEQQESVWQGSKKITENVITTEDDANYILRRMLGEIPEERKRMGRDLQRKDAFRFRSV